MWFWIILTAVSVGIVAQVGKGYMGALWGFLTLLAQLVIAFLMVGSAMLHAPHLLGTWAGDTALNLTVSGGGGLVMLAIVLTLPNRHKASAPDSKVK